MMNYATEYLERLSIVRRLSSIERYLEEKPLAANRDHMEKETRLLKGLLITVEKEEKVGFFRWKWNNQMGSRGREKSCIVIDEDAHLHLFTGLDIAQICRVINKNHERNGKWSNSTFVVLSKEGTSHISWYQDFDNGKYFPQSSWEEILAWIGGNVSLHEMKQFVKRNWPAEYAELEKNSDFSFFSLGGSKNG